MRELALKRVLPSQLQRVLSRKDQPLSGAIVVETCLAPLAKFQRAWIASPAPRAAVQHLYSWHCSRARGRRACLPAHAAALAVRRGPRAPWGTGRGSRNSMKISARRDSDHTRRRAGLARPPDLSTVPMPAPSRRYGDGLPVVFQRLSVATGLTARGAAFARPGGGPDAVWRSPDLSIGDRPRDSADARRPRRGRF